MTYDLTPFLERALGSEFFAGGALLAIAGVALAALRGLLSALGALVEHRCAASLRLDNRSAAFRHLWFWVQSSGAFAHVREVAGTGVHREEGEVFGPAPGRHWFVYRGRVGTLTRELSDKARTGGHSPRPMETLTVRIWFGGVATLRAWLAEGARLAAQAERRTPRLHLHSGDWWQEVGPVPPRDLGTILSEDDRIERLVADMRRFLAAEAWYAARGVPWRRGYLLYGPPGTGKSSAIRALATALRLDVAVLDLTRADLRDDGLREAMFDAPANAILAFEDVDAVFAGREAAGAKGISFSGLLNAIDGIAAQEGRALVMTTNHPERLDPALVRPGRIDLRVELGLVDGAAAARLYGRFFPGEPALAARFAEGIGEARLSPAAVQGWLLAHAEDAEAASRGEGLVGPALAAE